MAKALYRGKRAVGCKIRIFAIANIDAGFPERGPVPLAWRELLEARALAATLSPFAPAI